MDWQQKRREVGAALNGPAGYRGALLLSLLLTVPVLLRTLPVWLARYGQRPSWETTDLDTGLIHDGLLQAPHFVDTLQWWVGRWAGEVPFYRPLTSYVFWVEWKLFGDHEWWYGVPTFAAHVFATVLAAALAYRLAQRWRVAWPALAAVGTAAIFTGLTRDYRLFVVVNITNYWKNQPDSLAAGFCFLAVLSYLRAQSQGRSWAGGAIGYYLAACCFKEVAVPLPVVCAVLEVAELRTAGWRRPLARAGLLAGSGLLFLAFRAWAIEGVGYTYGSNNRWLDRTLLELLGPVSVAVPDGFWVGPLMGGYICLLAWLWWRTRPRWSAKRFGGLIAAASALLLFTVGAIAAGILFERFNDPGPWQANSWDQQCAQALLQPLTNPLYLPSVFGVIYMVVVTAVLWKRSRTTLWFAPVWTLAFLAPLTMSPGPIHRYYLPQFGYALLDALGFAALVAHLGPVLLRWWSARRALETSGKCAASAIQ
jgi:hypothetical protein